MPYEACLSRANPACALYLVEQSTAMAQRRISSMTVCLRLSSVFLSGRVLARTGTLAGWATDHALRRYSAVP